MFNTRLYLVREQGQKETRIADAKALLKNGVDKEVVIKSLNLTKEEIQELGIE